MAEKSLKRAYGMVEDVLGKVEDLYLPADFVILETGEDRDDSIILGRPFLATDKALIDVERGNLVLRLWEDHILFKIPNPQSPSDKGALRIETETPEMENRTPWGEPLTGVERQKGKGARRSMPIEEY
ncbi:uncharacterized protein [Arachis hypogaea]|uniref:uncharacterized protein n=1 Tax=Arachis hypogaea TaxID=3818 RepID=UPI003B217675